MPRGLRVPLTTVARGHESSETAPVGQSFASRDGAGIASAASILSASFSGE